MMLLRSANTRIMLLLVGVITLSTYLLLVPPVHPTPPAPPPPRQIVIDVEELEKELLLGERARQDVAFESPFDDAFFYGKLKAVGKHVEALDLRGVRTRLEAVRDAQKKVTQQRYNGLWTWADKGIRREELFAEGPEVDGILSALATSAIVHVEVLGQDDYESGTSEKWLLTLEGGQKAVMKIIWEEKGLMKKGGLCNLGFEMPWSEIAAFHLHRILGFRNTPFVSGRKIDLMKEILPAATPQVRKQIKLPSSGHNENKEACVTGKCYFCKKQQTLCPENGTVEASVGWWVTRPLKLYTYPPGYMPFSTPRMDEWGQYGLNNRTYCNKMRADIAPYSSDWYYYDLFDFAVLDTLMYHYDSKHYVIYDDSSARGLTVRLDHGRAFCAHDRDEENIFLAPLIQCCTLRASTYEKLKVLKHGNILTKRLKKSLEKDSLSPILHEHWFKALERRLKIILDTIDKCAKANGGLDKILINE